MAARRAVTISLPSSDPRSAVIFNWLAKQPPQSDVSAELRGLLVQALEINERLARIETMLARLLAAGLQLADKPTEQGEPSDLLSPEETAAAVRFMLNFAAAEEG